MISNDWLPEMKPEFRKPYYHKLYTKVNYEYSHYDVYPPKAMVFRAFELTPFNKVKAVIIGQDPYHGEGQAEGLCFSVKKGVDIPPSLLSIYREIHSDLGYPIPDNGSLVSWAKEGVFLLNSVLTVRAHQAFSHADIGWQEFTDAAIRVLNNENRPIVFMLWGRPAQKKRALLNNPNHLILMAAHPSPLSANKGFFGCRHFSKCNEFLVSHGVKPINWKIENMYN